LQAVAPQCGFQEGAQAADAINTRLRHQVDDVALGLRSFGDRGMGSILLDMVELLPSPACDGASVCLGHGE
jgi:hypothetical protein